NPVTVQIDFNGIAQRIIAVANVPVRSYSRLKAGVAGTVFYVETAEGDDDGPNARGGVLLRYRLSDRRANTFMRGVAAYSVSADGHKLLYRPAPPAGRGGRAGGPDAPESRPALFIVDADRNVPPAGAGRVSATLRMYLEPAREFKQIFDEGWRNQRDYLYV